MSKKSLFTRLYLWLVSPEVFGSINKKIPGKWQLYEYYTDSKDDLLHIQEAELKSMNESLVLDFSSDEEFSLTADLPISLFQKSMHGNWSVNRNYITLIDASDFRNNIEFQFAFEKDNLKLLKKDKLGKIEFFGFFTPEIKKV